MGRNHWIRGLSVVACQALTRLDEKAYDPPHECLPSSRWLTVLLQRARVR